MPSVGHQRSATFSAKILPALLILGLAMGLISCAGDKHKNYAISGTITGLTGSGLVLQNNAGDDLSITADGSFTFATLVPSRAAYTVTVKTQPTNPSQTCTVMTGSGTVSGAAVSNVTVTCTTNSYQVGGIVSGLSGSGLVLQNNAGDDLAITTNGTFTFATRIAGGAAYAVRVKTQPMNPSQTCAVSTGSGNISGTVNNVTVTCTTNTYHVGGIVSGLSGSGLVLQNNAGDDLEITSDGTFAFARTIASGAAYAVTVKTQPTNPPQTCIVSNGSGNVSGTVSNVAVSCSTNTYIVGGTVNGLAGTGLVLQNNAGDDLSITADGSFTFSTPVTSGHNYAVTVKTQPRLLPQNCTVLDGTGTITSSNVTNVSVECAALMPRFALVARCVTSSVTVFAINPSTGALTWASTAGLGLGGGCPSYVAVHPSMKFAYVADSIMDTISAFQINATTGALTPIANFAAGDQPNFMSFDPSGRFAYVSNSGSGSVSVYTVNESTGALTQIPGSPFVGGRAFQIAPSGRVAYAIGGSLATTFKVDTTGAISSSIASTPTLGGSTFAIDPGGRFLYVPYYSSSGSDTTYIGGFVITDPGTGVLATVPGFFAAGAGVCWVAVDPTGRFAYAVNLWSRTVMSYTIDQATGALTNIDVDNTEQSPNFVTVDPSGRFVYVANDWGSVSTFSIDSSTGRLTEVGTPYKLPAWGAYGSMTIAIVAQ